MTNRIEIGIEQRGPFADGHAFGATGPYERIVGRARYMVDPRAPAQAGIVDIDKAPVNNQGLVEFTGDIFILKPLEPERGNRRIFFDYGNRGNKRMLQFFNDAPPTNDPSTLAHAGNGFLCRRGYSIVFGSWQGDLLPGNGRMLLDLPVATDGDKPLTGLVRQEYIVNKAGVTSLPLSGKVSTRSHPTVSLDTRKARLTRRRYPDDERIPIAPDDWAFAQTQGGEGLDNQGAEIGIIPSDGHIYVKGGFDPGWIYEIIYTGRDPLVLGLGHVAVRDLISFLKYGDSDGAGNPNPLGGPAYAEKAYAWGRSQTGRCIRDFVYLGFNADAKGRKVFDGVIPHVAGAGRMWMNHRFANVISPAGQQYEWQANIADSFPFSYAESTDHLTSRTDAILKRPDTDPLVIHTQTATEYWQRKGALVHTDTQGNDLPQPETVRVYMWASSQHFADPNLQTPKRGICQNPINVVYTSPFFRAMLDAMDRWATEGTPPPPSRVPVRADGTLVPIEAWQERFPKIPGTATPRAPAPLALYDFGPEAEKGTLAEPPKVRDAKGYTVLIPAVDEDGNDIAGVRAPMVQAPLATYTGWNLRARGFGEGATFDFDGSTIPFPDTPQHREWTGDPRRSILERYGDAEGYVRAIVAAAHKLVAEGLMLEEDIERCAALARNWGRPRHDVRL